MKSKTSWMTKTALLLAITVLFQSIRIFYPALTAIFIGPFNLSTLIIGSLVNLIIAIAVLTVGLSSAITVGILSTVIALFQGHLQPPQMVLVVAMGNIIFALSLFIVKKPYIAGVILGAIAKAAFLYVTVQYAVIPMFVKAPKLIAALTISFSWVQLITALIGGIIAILILPALKKGIEQPN